jgi:NADH-quinone oxidoreductase subunit C
MNITIKTLKEELASAFKNVRIIMPDKKMITLECRQDTVHDILKYLKSIGYDHLALISCVDWIKDKKFEIVYILNSYTEEKENEGLHVLVKIKVPRDKPETDTIIDIFENAEPYERELHELFGIFFKGHPRLIQMFLERDYEIPPFRKDFDTRKYVKDIFDNVSSVEDKKKTKK